jgi:hypothetical protein
MSAHRGITFMALGLLAAPLAARAQARPDSAHRAALCWTAHPAPRCRVLLVTNFGLYADVVRPSGAHKGRLVEHVGLMANIGRRNAVGASFFATVDVDGVVSFGPELRYRHWMGEETALDLAVGARGPVAGVDHGAVIGVIKYDFSPYVAFALRPELVRRETPAGVWPVTHPVTGWGLGLSFGFEVGSWPGAVAPFVGGLVGLVEFLAHPPSI